MDIARPAAAWRERAASGLLCLSAACFAGLSSAWIYNNRVLDMPYPWLTGAIMALAGAACAAVLKFYNGWKDLFRIRAWQRLSLLALAAYTCAAYFLYFQEEIEPAGFADARVFSIMAVLSGPALYVFFGESYRWAHRIFGALFGGDGRFSRHEFIFLACFMAASITFSAWAFTAAPILYDGARYGGLQADVVYLFDSQYHMTLDSFFRVGSVENDIRNLFFGLSALPVAAPCRVLGGLLELASGMDFYAYLLAWAQCAAVAGSILLFSRAACGSMPGQIGLCILFACCYSTVLNTIILEQYAFPLFWMAAFVYLHGSGRTGPMSDACYVLAAGGITSASLLAVPAMLDDKKRAPVFIKNAAAGAAAALCLSGQPASLLRSARALPTTAMFFGIGVPAGNILKQFTVFVRSIFLQPSVKAFSVSPWFDLDGDAYAAYWLSDDLAFDAIGIGLFVIAAISVFVNRDDRFCRSCAWWAGASVLILAVLGWGSYENGFVIYVLHFGWAYICLAFKLLDRLLGKYPAVVLGSCAAAGGLLLWQNAGGMAVLFDFLGRYYPA